VYESIKTDLQDGVMTVTLNRPHKMNAFTLKMSEELIHFYEEVNNKDDVRVVVVTGAGSTFCAGLDLADSEKVLSPNVSEESYRDIGGQVSLQMLKVNKPIIAAINGAAIGIGMTMTLPMDIRIMQSDAKAGFVFSQRGIGPEACSGWILPRLVGVGKAMEWMITGNYISADEALAAGLVQYVERDPLAKAYEIAKGIVERTAPTSVAFTRQLLWGMLKEKDPMTSHLLESRFLHWAGQGDAKEGIASFLENRQAIFNKQASDLPDFFNS